jgi:hypothetical protein
VYLQAAKQLTTLARASDSRAADFVKVETDMVVLAEEQSIHSCSDLQTLLEMAQICGTLLLYLSSSTSDIASLLTLSKAPQIYSDSWR